MPRPKVTSRRGKPLFQGTRTAPRLGSVKPYLRFATQQYGQDSLSAPEVHVLMRSSLPTQELSDGLIEFMSQSQSISEPPRKRQKRAADMEFLGKEPELDYILVKVSTWEIKHAGSNLSGLEMPLERNDIRRLTHWEYDFLEIFNESGISLFREPFPTNEPGLEDTNLAFLVDQEAKRWTKGQGRLWTELGLRLLRKEESDCLQVVFKVKWNITTSPYHIAQAMAKTPALQKILNSYFPDSNSKKINTWTPQDFYQSVHVPDKVDDVAASIETNLESSLYPFQKRAVQWLLRKEGVEWSNGSVTNYSPSSRQSVLPFSFFQATDALGKQCYVSQLFGLVTLDPALFMGLEKSLNGGILAEEMGLGKTVEMISLMTLHKRPQTDSSTVLDTFIDENVRLTPATLIVTPPSILQQWISDINRHAPHLKVTHYEGIKAQNNMDSNLSELVDDLATSDVVLTTYSVLAAEIHYTKLNGEKSLRQKPKYPRPKSPLMQLSWWRVCIDEAQMIESGVSKAAVVARMIPRINAWCITGTPVRKDVNDLHGLLVFLRHEPYASTKHIWASLISSHKNEFRKLFGTLALRHSKQSVRNELKLPAQRRYVITMPFTPIEEQHYQELFNQMCEDSGLNSEGAPLIDNWEPDDVAETMRRWLVRLRQTALHPEVGGRNRRALGHKDGPLRTVDQVLDVMADQTDVAIRTDQRTLLTSKLKRGQLFENSPRVKEALDIWVEAAKEASEIVEECREQLQQEIMGTPGGGRISGKGSRSVSGNDSDSSDSEDE
jgi:E3 ubiquitin-protein ligase SHPRH